MRVLIIEDEVRLASTLQDLLDMNGYTADVCHDGESGLDNALSGIYDVVLLDVMLPKMDGFTVLRNLRAAGNAVPVLMLTARSELSDRVEGLDCGADYYLTKPFEPRELLACIRGETTLEAAAGLIRQKSRNYAKRQLTWFRRDKRIHWICFNAPEAAVAVLQEATDYLQNTLYNG